MVVEAVPVDFGNGIVAYTALTAGDNAYLEKGHEGFHAPELDVLVTENAVNDGGYLGATRALARNLRCTISHNRKWTRREILQAFVPGVDYVLSTPLGSMPYRVKASVEFPESLFLAQFRFTVTLVSPLAYPLAPPRSATAGGTAGTGLVYPYEYPATYDTAQAVAAFGVESGCEVPTPVKIVAVLATGASELAITIADRTTRLVGAFIANDVVVIDPTPLSPVVTVNGVNKLSWFDVSSEWPELDPGYSEVSISTFAQLTLQWSPRIMGLI